MKKLLFIKTFAALAVFMVGMFFSYSNSVASQKGCIKVADMGKLNVCMEVDANYSCR